MEISTFLRLKYGVRTKIGKHLSAFLAGAIQYLFLCFK